MKETKQQRGKMAAKSETQVMEGDNWFSTDALVCLCAHTQTKCNDLQASVLSGHKVLPSHFHGLALIFLAVSTFLCTRARIQCVFFNFLSLHSLNLFHATDFHPVPSGSGIMIFTSSMPNGRFSVWKWRPKKPLSWRSFLGCQLFGTLFVTLENYM